MKCQSSIKVLSHDVYHDDSVLLDDVFFNLLYEENCCFLHSMSTSFLVRSINTSLLIQCDATLLSYHLEYRNKLKTLSNFRQC